MLLEIIGAILSMVGSWMIFKKMGRQGWEGIVPIYSTYVLCKVLYGNGWKFLLLLIPFGVSDNTGNTGWLRFFGIGIEPTEVVKLTLIIILAKQISYLKV